MGEKVCVDIVEQCAIFDGKPEFSLPLSAVIDLLNCHSYGGTPNDMNEVINDGILSEPKRYKITLRLDYEEL